MVLKRGSQDCHCVYPIKIDLLLLNVSSNPDWNDFLSEFANGLGLQVSQIELINFYMLGLSRLNISMDVTPHKGIGFSANEAAGINSSLSLHKVRLNPELVGDYHVLNLTWFRPPTASQGKSFFHKCCFCWEFCNFYTHCVLVMVFKLSCTTIFAFMKTIGRYLHN